MVQHPTRPDHEPMEGSMAIRSYLENLRLPNLLHTLAEAVSLTVFVGTLLFVCRLITI